MRERQGMIYVAWTLWCVFLIILLGDALPESLQNDHQGFVLEGGALPIFQAFRFHIL